MPDQDSTLASSVARSASVLVADDEPEMLELMEDILTTASHSVTCVRSGVEAIEQLGEADFDVIVSDVVMPGAGGVDMLRWLRKQERDIPVILVTGNATVQVAIDAMKLGAWEFLEKPFDPAILLAAIRNAMENRRLRRQNAILRRQIAEAYDFSSIIGDSKAIREVIDRVKAVADVSAPVLITGESGTGKSLFAHVIHYNGPRHDRPLVTATLDAMSPESMDVELFGSVGGTDPESVGSRSGLVLDADNSTLYLKEVAALPLHLQPKVLAVIQEGRLTPTGTNRSREVSVRVIASTTRDLEAEVMQGTFREDLYYMLKTVTVGLPTLRSRKQDVVPLAMHFLREAAEDHGRPAREFSEGAKRIMRAHRWPGNVRELVSVIQQAVVLCRKSVVEESDLQLPVAAGIEPISGTPQFQVTLPDWDLTLKEITADVVAQVERFRIAEALERSDGSRGRAAQILGISLRTLMYKLKEHDLS